MDKKYISRIKTEDITPEVRKVMAPFFARLKTKEGVEGIVELGGLGKRNFSDIHSDIDASVFVSKPQSWLPMFEFYVPTPKTSLFRKTKFFEINIHQNTIRREYGRREWEEGKKEAYEEGKIVYDFRGNVAKLIDSKIYFDKKKSLKRIKELSSAIYSFRATGRPVQDHLAINKMINQAIEIMYLANGEFRPHKKWRLEKARYLKRIPGNFDELVREMYLVREMSEKDVKRRLSGVRSFVRFYASKPESMASRKKRRISEGNVYSVKEQKMMASLILGQLYWLVDVNPMRQVERGFIYNSHDLLNEGITLALESRRVIKGQKIRQNVEALSVIRPPLKYDEDQYALIEKFSLNDSDNVLASALLVPDFSIETVRKRVSNLQKITKPLQAELVKKGFVPEDPYHFAVANCYFDRQLLFETYAEKVCPKGLPEEDRKLCQGFVSYHLVGSGEELRRALKKPIRGVYSESNLRRIKSVLGGAL